MVQAAADAYAANVKENEDDHEPGVEGSAVADGLDFGFDEFHPPGDAFFAVFSPFPRGSLLCSFPGTRMTPEAVPCHADESFIRGHFRV